MRRNLDLCVKILEQVEAKRGTFEAAEIVVEGFDEDTVGYHVRLLCDAGLLEGLDSTGIGSRGYRTLVTHLTNEGHEYLEAHHSGGEPPSLVSTAQASALRTIAKHLDGLGRSFTPFGLKIDR